MKFYGRNQLVLSKPELLSTLSSGTVPGLRIINSAREVLKKGGYLLLDEIEVNLNTTIISDIIHLFLSGDTNPHNATLIFTTHYIEVLDTFERNDQIRIVHKDNTHKIEISNYVTFENRNDLIRSEAIFSDYHNLETSIDYDKYLAFRKSFISNE